jgi:very-short-patch-repair endonuclease
MRSSATRSVPSHRELLLASRARQLRLSPTPSEAALWAVLRLGLLGVSFKRQIVVGRFIVDLLAPSVGLIVELDGPVHCARTARDARRDRVLRRMGYRVLRLEAQLVEQRLADAVARVREMLAALP